MQDTTTFIASVEEDIARSEERLAELERLAMELGDMELPFNDETHALFEQFQASCECSEALPGGALPMFGIRI